MTSTKEAAKPFQAGAAKVKLTYPEGFFPHISFRGRYFTGVRDDLYVRALLIAGGEEVLLLSIELGDIDDAWLDEIGSAAGVPSRNVFLTATHTHAAPHACGTWPEDVKDLAQSEAFGVLCKGHAIEAARRARQNLRPAQMRYNFGRCDINVNRDYKYTGADGKITAPYIQAPNHGGISDKTVAVLRFEDAKGQAIAYFVNYAVHSNVTFYQTWSYDDGAEGMLVSGDLAGIAMEYVERHSDDGTVAMFTMGASADQMPKYLGNHRVFDREGNADWEYYGREAGHALADAQATALASEVLRVAARMPFALPALEIGVTQGRVSPMGKVDGAGKPPAAKEGVQNTYALQYKESVAKDFQYEPTRPVEMTLSLLRLGPVALVGIPAEIVTNIGADMKCMVSNTIGVDAIIMTQCNGSYSYISDDRGYKQMTFEAMASHFMPGVGEKLLDGLRSMLEAQ